MDADHKPIDILVEKADGVIDEYRHIYTPETPHEGLYNDVERLYVAKEAASIVEAYAELAERTMRRHEGMLGFFGSTLRSPISLLIFSFFDFEYLNNLSGQFSIESGKIANWFGIEK